jgi:hypothetical protein
MSVVSSVSCRALAGSFNGYVSFLPYFPGSRSNVPFISTLLKCFPHKVVDSESKQTISQKLQTSRLGSFGPSGVLMCIRSLGGRLLEPLRLNNAILERNAMLERCVAERQRLEIIACGGSTSSTPRKDAIKEMQKKLRELVPKAMGDGIRLDEKGTGGHALSGTSALGRNDKQLVGH